MPSRGVEPLLQVPQTCVLSIERQGHDKIIKKLKNELSDQLKFEF